MDAAQSLVSIAISSGFRESGITSASKRMIIAIRCSIRLEVPLGDTKKLMVSPEYVEYLVEVANEKMGANRKRTDLFLNKLIDNGFPAHEIRVNCETNRNDEETSVEAESSIENEAVVLDRELQPESKYNHDTDCGNCYS